MKKAAIFVEGQTELVFVRKLLEELAGSKNISFNEEALHARNYITLQGSGPAAGSKYFVLIIDCRGDHAVKSAILERRPGLMKAGYDLILGLRDLYPLPKGDFAKLEQGLRYGLPTAGLPTYICIAVMELEAWFAQEEFHYQSVDACLTKIAIKTVSGFDLDVDCAENIVQPAVFLNQVYKIAGKSYKKSRANVNNIVNAIDYANLFYNLQSRLPSFESFASHIDQFLS